MFGRLVYLVVSKRKASALKAQSVSRGMRLSRMGEGGDKWPRGENKKEGGEDPPEENIDV